MYFADICAGPGGFSEYVMWRKKWRAKGSQIKLFKTPELLISNHTSALPFIGFGLTLRDSQLDFKLSVVLCTCVDS